MVNYIVVAILLLVTIGVLSSSENERPDYKKFIPKGFKVEALVEKMKRLSSEVKVGEDTDTHKGLGLGGGRSNLNLIERNHTMISLCSDVQMEHRKQCIHWIETIFENVFTALYLDYVRDLDNFIEKAGFDLLFVEGGSTKFFNSLLFKQDIMYTLLWERLKSTHSNNDTLQFCETGFNAGHSSLFWLLYDDRINVVSFDIGSNKYVLAASRWMEMNFPSRFRLIIGDSTVTLPKFRQQHPSFRCDFWFIDGGHSYSVATSDLSNALSMSHATNAHHDNNINMKTYIIFDDTNMEDVRRAWENAKSHGFIKNPTFIDDSFMPCLQIDASNYQITPCTECKEMNAAEIYPETCRGANLTHIRVSAGVASPLVKVSTDRIQPSHRHIKSLYPAVGTATVYPIYMNNLHTMMCLPFRYMDQTTTVHDFFKSYGFDGLELKTATKTTVKHVQEYFAGYPLQSLGLHDRVDHRTIGCPNPESAGFKKAFPGFWNKEEETKINFSKKTTTFAVAAQFKNEAIILSEWIEHYIDEGCSHFFLINNNSTDNFLSILGPYIQKGLITLFSNPTQRRQVINLNVFVLPLAHLYTFIVPVDLDEFIYGRNKYENILSYLSNVSDCVDAIVIPSKNFGTNSNIKQPTSVIYGNTRRMDFSHGAHELADGYEMGSMENTKTIVRSKSVKYFSLHRHTMLEKIDGSPVVIVQSNNEFEIPSNIEVQKVKGFEKTMYFNVEHEIIHGKIQNSGVSEPWRKISNCVSYITEAKLKNHHLHLNHYTLQSKEFYFKVKIKRGDAVQSFNRTQKSFKFQEKLFNQIYDNELEAKTKMRRRRRESREPGKP